MADYLETHGLDCGPYEHWRDEWYECSACGARFDPTDEGRDPPDGHQLPSPIKIGDGEVGAIPANRS